ARGLRLPGPDRGDRARPAQPAVRAGDAQGGRRWPLRTRPTRTRSRRATSWRRPPRSRRRSSTWRSSSWSAAYVRRSEMAEFKRGDRVVFTKDDAWWGRGALVAKMPKGTLGTYVDAPGEGAPWVRLDTGEH